MTTKWEAFDLHDEFSLGLAACLWAESLPEVSDRQSFQYRIAEHVSSNPEVHSIHSALVNYIRTYIEGPNFKFNQEPYKIRRDVLVEYANKVGQKPKFLFPEEQLVKENSYSENDDSEPALSDTQVDDTRSYNSWRRMVKILAIASNNHPDNRNTVGKLVKIAASNGISLSDESIRNYLKDAFQIDTDLEKTN